MSDFGSLASEKIFSLSKYSSSVIPGIGGIKFIAPEAMTIYFGLNVAEPIFTSEFEIN